jgi:hypothetical protein
MNVAFRAKILRGLLLTAACIGPALTLTGCRSADGPRESANRSTYFSDRAAAERRLEKNFTWQQLGLPSASPYSPPAGPTGGGGGPGGGGR